MGDDHGFTDFGYLLDIIVVTALIGTFVLYGNPANTGRPAAAPREIATLGPQH